MRTEQLREVAASDGPFVSVVLDATHAAEDAAHRDELRWQAAAAELTEQGADEPTLRAIEEAVLGEAAVGEAGRALIAAHGHVLLDEFLPRPPRTETVRVADLPCLVPVVASSPRPIPHVVVVADKTGGQVHGVDRDDTPMPTDSVSGRDKPVHPVRGGGPAHRTIENRAEETVRQNTAQVADRAAHLVEKVSAEVVVLVGEVQARTAVRNALPAHCQRLVAELDLDAETAERDPELVTTGVNRILAEFEAAHDLDTLERLRSAEAHELGREGMPGVVKALRAAQVDTLIITDPLLADRHVWCSDDLTQLSTAPEEGAEKRRADEALPVVAVATAADVVVLPGAAELTDGIGALLRYP